MNNHLKTLKFALIFTAIFSIFAFSTGESFAFAPESTANAAQTNVQTATSEQNVSAPQSIPEKNAYELSHMQKTGFKYQIFKFFTAMFGVLVSAIAIYFGLKFYKNFILKNNQKLDNIDYDNSLETPKDFKEAINLFLDKTDK